MLILVRCLVVVVVASMMSDVLPVRVTSTYVVSIDRTVTPIYDIDYAGF